LKNRRYISIFALSVILILYRAAVRAEDAFPTLFAAEPGRIYNRANNIHQPKPQYIYIPMNRVVRLIIKFDGKSYEYEVVPIYQ
jgi:hypothetical protein